jgi:hypothetical protein
MQLNRRDGEMTWALDLSVADEHADKRWFRIINQTKENLERFQEL